MLESTCKSLMAVDNLDWLEPRSTTRSHNATELTWEDYEGWGVEVISEWEQKEEREGQEGFAFYRGI